jgi:hypothetical protein
LNIKAFSSIGAKNLVDLHDVKNCNAKAVGLKTSVAEKNKQKLYP